MKTPRIQLIPVGEKEIGLLHRLSVETFKETFEAENKKEDLLAYLNQKMSTVQLKKELNNPFSSFFFATYKKQMAGYLKLNFDNAQTENVLNNQAFEIERIYLLKEYQNKGLGTELFEAAIQIGKEKGYSTLWLGVWEKNRSALQFYQKKGLITFGSHCFQLGSDPQTDLLMRYDFDS